MSQQVPLDQRPRQRLLGGWRNLVDDLSRLQRLISTVDGVYRCGHAAGANPTCPCCESAVRDLVAACEHCRAEIAAVAKRVAAVEEDTLRYLPAVLDLFVRMPDRYAEAIVVQHSLIQLLQTFRRLQAAAGEWAQGCRTTHLPAVKERAQEVSSACRHFDDAVARLV